MPSRGDTIDKAIALRGESDVVEFLRRRMPDSLKQLEDIACGNVPRNAATILKGIELQLRYTQPLPKVTVEHQGAVGIAVIDPYAELREGEEPGSDGALSSGSAPALALPAARAVVPVAPIRRKKAAPQEPKE